MIFHIRLLAYIVKFTYKKEFYQNFEFLVVFQRFLLSAASDPEFLLIVCYFHINFVANEIA